VIHFLRRWIGETWDTSENKWIDPPDNGIPRSFEEMADLPQGTIVKVYAYQEKTHKKFLRNNWAGVKYWKRDSFKKWKHSKVVVK
jgi:hypothetical protein